MTENISDGKIIYDKIYVKMIIYQRKRVSAQTRKGTGMTIQDVAKRANVSITTVSMVLNGRPVRVSKEKREAIFQAAKELGYQGRHNAKKRRDERRKTLGLIIPDICSYYFAELAKGILMRAKREGFDLVVCDSDNKVTEDVENLKNLQQKDVDGIILALSGQTSETFHRVTEQISQLDRIPIVLIDRDDPEHHCHGVSVNQIKGSSMAVEYLLQLGHRKIGYLAGDCRLKVAKDRMAGYQKTMEQWGIAWEKNWVYMGDYEIDSGYKLCDRFLEAGVTAICAGNDMMAFGVMKRLRERKIKVPEEISVVGFDDVALAGIMEIPLTTVRQPIQEMGERAVQILKQYEKRPDSKEKTIVVLQPELVIRESTAAFQG